MEEAAVAEADAEDDRPVEAVAQVATAEEDPLAVR